MRTQETIFEPSEEDLYRRAIRQPLAKKVERAVALLKLFEPQAINLTEEGFYGCFSGGKDSVVLAELLRMSGVRHTLNYSITTIDPPEIVWFIKEKYPQCKRVNLQGLPLPLKMARHSRGPPTIFKRWCCEAYKETGGDGLAKVTGVRAEESARRKGLWREVNKNRARDGGLIICPIIYWTDEDIWTFIRENNLPYCSLYDEGFGRLGCIGCPFGGPKGKERDFKRWPRYERLWKLGFQRYWQKFHGTKKRNGEDRFVNKFEKWEDLWEWWVRHDVAAHKTPSCQMYLW